METRLKQKIEIAQNNIIEWYEYWEGKVYVAFSGGRDSTVLLHLVRSIYPDVPGLFFNTGLEYPEITMFVKKQDNIIMKRPSIPFQEVIKKYGFPIISKQVAGKIDEIRKTNDMQVRNKRLLEESIFILPKKWRPLLKAPFKISQQCCKIMKKDIAHKYQKETGRKPMIGLLAEESRYRKYSWKKFGCNIFRKKDPQSRPIMSWSFSDVLAYIDYFGVPISTAYTKLGLDRTGCMFCGFGIHLEREPNRFQKMKKTHPRHYKYIIHRLGMGEVLDFLGIKYD